MSSGAFVVRGVLLDVEGTTSSIKFVYEILFPFARRELDDFLQQRLKTPDFAATLDLLANDCGDESFVGFLAKRKVDSKDRLKVAATIRDEVLRLMDGDFKGTGLKDLQGRIWEAGFHSGELKAHVYPDVPPALKEWNRAGIDVRIYSSGSIAAQRLFFGHTVVGDLLPYFRGHYDSTIGGKRDADSYVRIAKEYGFLAEEILFLSDVVVELDAAAKAGCKTGLLVRPGNPPQKDTGLHPVFDGFKQLDVRLARTS